MNLSEFLQGQRIYAETPRTWWQRLLHRPRKFIPMHCNPDDVATMESAQREMKDE